VKLNSEIKAMKYKKLLPILLLITYSTFGAVFEKIFFENDSIVASVFLTQVEGNIMLSKVFVAFKLIKNKTANISFYSQYLVVDCSNKQISIIEELLSAEAYGKYEVENSSVDIGKFRELVQPSYKSLYPQICM